MQQKLTGDMLETCQSGQWWDEAMQDEWDNQTYYSEAQLDDEIRDNWRYLLNKRFAQEVITKTLSMRFQIKNIFKFADQLAQRQKISAQSEFPLTQNVKRDLNRAKKTQALGRVDELKDPIKREKRKRAKLEERIKQADAYGKIGEIIRLSMEKLFKNERIPITAVPRAIKWMENKIQDADIKQDIELASPIIQKATIVYGKHQAMLALGLQREEIQRTNRFNRLRSREDFCDDNLILQLSVLQENIREQFPKVFP